jgi:hypothetical protein
VKDGISIHKFVLISLKKIPSVVERGGMACNTNS